LEQDVTVLQQNNISLTTQNAKLKQKNEQLERENEELKKRLGLLEESKAAIVAGQTSSAQASCVSCNGQNIPNWVGSVGSAEFINAPQPQEQEPLPVKEVSPQQSLLALLLMMQFAYLLTIMSVTKSLTCSQSALKNCWTPTLEKKTLQMRQQRQQVRQESHQQKMTMSHQSATHCKMKMMPHINWSRSMT